MCIRVEYPFSNDFSLRTVLCSSGCRKYGSYVIKWKHFPRYRPFVRGIHRSPLNSPHIGPWRGALMFSFICVWINGWVNNLEAGDLRRYRTHYEVIVMIQDCFADNCMIAPCNGPNADKVTENHHVIANNYEGLILKQSATEPCLYFIAYTFLTFVMVDMLSISCEIVFRWRCKHRTDDQSTLV